ncbi:MAG: hypothetical protein JNN15_10490 [Blastocatellia bacterium]|nr:hypothetical protein [Blastocatellia bacterium]
MVQKIGKHLHSFCILTALFPPAKFLSKAGRVPDARTEIDKELNTAKDKSYLFNYAQLLFWDGHLNVYERKEQEAVRKFQECINLCQQVGDNRFVLYPLLLISQLYIVGGANELAFINSFEGLEGSSKYKMATFLSQFLQNAGLAAGGLNKVYLAKGCLEEAVNTCEKEGLWGYGSVLKANLAAILAQQGDTRKAIQLIETAKTVDVGKTLDPSSKRQQLMHISLYEGKIYGLAKNYIESERSYRNFINTSEELGYKNIISTAQARKGLGEALLEQGRKPEAAKEFDAAKEEFRKIHEGLHPKNDNKFLDYSFSGKDIDELIKLVQR